MNNLDGSLPKESTKRQEPSFLNAEEDEWKKEIDSF